MLAHPICLFLSVTYSIIHCMIATFIQNHRLHNCANNISPEVQTTVSWVLTPWMFVGWHMFRRNTVPPSSGLKDFFWGGENVGQLYRWKRENFYLTKRLHCFDMQHHVVWYIHNYVSKLLLLYLMPTLCTFCHLVLFCPADGCLLPMLLFKKKTCCFHLQCTYLPNYTVSYLRRYSPQREPQISHITDTLKYNI
jgi:hypothetical protein